MKQENPRLNFYVPQFFNEDIATTGFFTRNGGISTGDYSSLNCSIKSSDPNIEHNLKLVANELGARHEIKQAYQTHSIDVITIDDANIDTRKIEADALVTNLSGLPISVITADCTPILFIDETAKVIGAAHAGWRGAFAGIIENTIKAMEKLGATKNNIKACIGPCISQVSYEVDAAFHQQFLDQSADNSQYFYLSTNQNHFMFDLPKYCEDRLKKMDLDIVENLRLDTYKNENLFFSHRRRTHRNEKNTGHQISTIVLK